MGLSILQHRKKNGTNTESPKNIIKVPTSRHSLSLSIEMFWIHSSLPRLVFGWPTVLVVEVQGSSKILQNSVGGQSANVYLRLTRIYCLFCWTIEHGFIQI